MLLVGDVHGKYEEYLKIIDQYPSSIQLGDMGFDYSHFDLHPKYRNHKFIGGNHENMDKIKNCKNSLGDFGLGYQAGHEFFFVRGANSIDRIWRIEGVSWWREEELSYVQAEECLQLYKSLGKPKHNNILLSHDCPQFLVDHLWGYEPSFTRKLLNAMWEIRKPKLWVFGHHHKHIDLVIEGCRFVCLNELETMVI